MQKSQTSVLSHQLKASDLEWDFAEVPQSCIFLSPEGFWARIRFGRSPRNLHFPKPWRRLSCSNAILQNSQKIASCYALTAFELEKSWLSDPLPLEAVSKTNQTCVLLTASGRTKAKDKSSDKGPLADFPIPLVAIRLTSNSIPVPVHPHTYTHHLIDFNKPSLSCLGKKKLTKKIKICDKT